nr:hypothetical protein BaRGS_004314 [Batillaria attramentaria]
MQLLDSILQETNATTHSLDDIVDKTIKAKEKYEDDVKKLELVLYISVGITLIAFIFFLVICTVTQCVRLDESNFSVDDKDYDGSSEDEVFNISDIHAADKKSPLANKPWTRQTTPY